MVRRFKVGGIHFLRINRMQFSFCMCRHALDVHPASLPAVTPSLRSALTGRELVPVTQRVPSTNRDIRDHFATRYARTPDPVEEFLMAFAVTMCIAAVAIHIF